MREGRKISGKACAREMKDSGQHQSEHNNRSGCKEVAGESQGK